MTLWPTIAQDLGLASHSEASFHPHVPDERADLFHSADGGSTEFEYLNLLHAFVIAGKPKLLLETGTYKGSGALAIASALAFNGFGKLITVDRGECAEAKEQVKKYGLEGFVEFVRADSIQFCAGWAGDPFQLCFLDSDPTARHRECDILRQRTKLSQGAFVIFHDSSELRYGVSTSWEMIQYLRHLPGGVEFRLSRGLRVWQVGREG